MIKYFGAQLLFTAIIYKKGIIFFIKTIDKKREKPYNKDTVKAG